MANGYDLPVAQWMGTNLVRDGEAFRWQLDFTVMERLLLDFFRTDMWRAVEHPSPLHDVHILKASQSNAISPAAVTRSRRPPGRTCTCIIGMAATGFMPNSRRWSRRSCWSTCLDYNGRVKLLLRTLTVVLVCIALGACRSNEPLKVSTIQVGRAISSDNQVGNHTTVFRPDDTIYVSVLTTDTGSGTIGVKWLFGDRLHQRAVAGSVVQRGGSHRVPHPELGRFPEGKYSVEAFLDGASVGKRTFSVEKP